MEQLNIRDIIGPIMIGPSSSHTAGALACAKMARCLLRHAPRAVTFDLYGSFSHTYRGHGTDRALVAGFLGFDADDLRIRDSFACAREAGLDVTINPLPDEPFDHPNTVVMHITRHDGRVLHVTGVSVGGGAALLTDIDGVSVEITGKTFTLLTEQTDHPGVLAGLTGALSHANINIANLTLYRKSRGGEAFTIMEVDGSVPIDVQRQLEKIPYIKSVRCIEPVLSGAGTPCQLTDEQQDMVQARFADYDFASGAELLARCQKFGLPISGVMLERDHYFSLTEGYEGNTPEYLERALCVMRESVLGPLSAPVESMGGLIGGEGYALRALSDANRGILGNSLVGRASAYALSVLETNASMGRIVAAPTAGSAGVIPAVLIALGEEKGYTDAQLATALANAAAVGYLIARNAYVSGAQGGCQAEIGAAAAMAASAAVELAGGTPQECLDAAGNAIANLLGLVCDPVSGLVEVPCQKRNAVAAANALISADIALAGVRNLVDFDATVQAMYKVGRSLPFELRESALGGIAEAAARCAECGACGLQETGENGGACTHHGHNDCNCHA